MRIVYDPSKAKEVLINLALLTTKTSKRKDQLRLRLIMLWYTQWFQNPQDEELYQAWSPEWNGILSQSSYRFPLPEKTFERTPKAHSKKAYLIINEVSYTFSQVKIYPVEKQFSNKSLIVQKSQFFVSFPIPETNEFLVVVSVKEKGDILVPYSHLRIGRQI